MNIKSILLGTAAGLMVSSAAMAADLPSDPAPAAVDYVKVCDAFGAGFFYIPGTDTCLDISGRVRFTSRYDATTGAENYSWNADGRVQFDARTATDYGTLRSFFELTSGRTYNTPGADGIAGTADDGVDTRGVGIGAAFLQLGYLSAGYMGSLWNGDVLFGIDDAGNGLGDQVGISVVADDLGGGFIAGIALEGANDTVTTNFGDFDVIPDVVLTAGMVNQPWGSVQAYFLYSADLTATAGNDGLGAKLAGNFVVMDGVNLRATAAYFSDTNNIGPNTESIQLSLAVSAAVSDAATIYAGARYDMDDPTDDDLFANIGIDYTVTPGLVATGELSYADVDGADAFQVIGRLTRNW